MKEGFRRGVELFKDKDVKQAFQEGADEGQIVGILAEREEWEAAGSICRSSSLDWKKNRNRTEPNCKRPDHQLWLHKF